VRNPVRASTGSRPASDSDIIAGFFLWADCDDPASEGNVRRFDGPKYASVVRTGTVPSVRVHVYWTLAEPCYDLAAWRRAQEAIASHFGSDRTVVNPSRIMRLGGTVSYPDSRKQSRGYAPELVRIKTASDDAHVLVSLDQMMRVFGSAAAPAHQATPLSQRAMPSAPSSGPHNARIELEPHRPALDREDAVQRALAGEEWHNNTIRLVASYVARGLSDDEIHGLTERLTLPGWTVADTRREVQAAIDGARRKGWAPQPQAAPQITPQQREAIPPAMFRPWIRKDLAAIPYPEFLYGDFYARGYTSLTVAPPKVGKSMLALAEALDMATGRGFLSGLQRPSLRVVYYNAEDDQDVIDARVSALLAAHGIDQSEIEGRFWPTSGVNAEGFYLIRGQEGVINEQLFVSIEKFCAEQAADVLIFDPLQDLSTSPETNEVFRLLGQRIRWMASQSAISIHLVHHTRKVAPGMNASIDDSRGGSALRGTARFNRVLNLMTEDEAVKAGVPNHRHFFRIGDMESNLAPPSADVNRWFEKRSIIAPNGQNIGIVEPWKWPDAFAGVTAEDAARVRNAIAAMSMEPPRLDPQARTWVGHEVARVLRLDSNDKGDRERIKTLVRTWINTGVLAVEERHDARNGREAKVVVAGPNSPSAVG
jgi:hypothetical protein